MNTPTLTFALAGNQNCGKSTLFNALTGSSRHTGNYPGITVEAETGEVKALKGVMVADLPGTYSLRNCTGEEQEALRVLRSGNMQGIVNVCDATNLPRSLGLTLELLELGLPMVVALNMMDEAGEGAVDLLTLENALGVEVVPISAAKNRGIDGLLRAMTRAGAPENANIPRDPGEICKKVLKKPGLTAQARRTRAIDRVMTGKITGIPIFAMIMYLIFRLTFGIAGSWGQKMLTLGLEAAQKAVGKLLAGLGASEVLRELVTQGIMGGVGAVLGFLPTIATLYFLLGVLEDSGYMARVAFILDSPMRRLGLSGRAAVPLLMGFGCTVSGVMACRTLTSREERARTIALIPFMSCPAKLPVYSALAGAFFPGHETEVLLGLYGLGAAVAIAIAALTGHGRDSGFLLELPNYRLPSLKNTLRLVEKKTREFLSRAFSVIFLASLGVWCLSRGGEASPLAALGRVIAPVFRPLGFGHWALAAALAVGMAAKEATLSTLTLLAGSGALTELMEPRGAAAFLVFFLLYPPCAAALTAMRQELKSPVRTGALFLGQLALAWLAARLVFGG